MGVNLSKTPHVIFFAGFLPALSFFLAWLFSQLVPDLPFWVENLSPLLAYAFLYSWFERSLWKSRIFRIVGVVCFPDLHGRWCGNQHSSHAVNGVKVDVPVCLEIKQTFSKISIMAYYQKSFSASIVSSFAEVNDDFYLFYTYDNEPNSLKEGTMQMHKGTVKLKHVDCDNKLIGIYFNNIGNHGEMDLNFKGHDFLCRFAD